MNMFEEARALRGMISMCSLTQSEIAKKMGVSQSYVANKIRLLNFSDEVQNLIIASNLSERHARMLLKIKDDESIKVAIEKIKAMNLNVAASEALIDGLIYTNEAQAPKGNDAKESVIGFEEAMLGGIRFLKSRGVNAKSSVDIYGNKKYITITIEE